MFCSTIIPAVGRPSLARAVQSVLDQSFGRDFEIVVVNDSGRQLTLNGDVAHTTAVVASKLDGAGWQTSSTNYLDSPEANRWSRNRLLAKPGAFKRMRASASSPYWRGRILQAYLATAHWNWKRGQYPASASRAAFALFRLALAGPWLLTRPYWQALRVEHVPGSPLVLRQAL